MFKLGGQADQGSGIMSTVEPKRTMRQNPYTGYAIGGRIMAQEGYNPFTYFSPEVVTDEERATRSDIYPFEKRDSAEILNALSYTPLGRAGSGLNILRQAGKYGAKNKPDFYTGVSGQAQRALDDAPFLSNQYIREAVRPYASGAAETLKQAGTGIKDFARKYGIATGVGAGGAGTVYGALRGDEDPRQPITDKKFGLDEESGEFATGISKERELLKKEGVITPPPGRKDNKYGETETSKPFNLLDEVKKESQELRTLLGQDDDTLKAEAALVLSEALGTPGTIAQKIQRGLKAAVPLKKARAEQDKAITLTAYKLAKEKEQQQIRAGTLPTSIREAEYVAKSLKESGDPRYADMTIQQIINENIKPEKKITEEQRAVISRLKGSEQSIIDKANSLNTKELTLNRLDPVKDKAKYEKTKELYNKELQDFYRDYLSLPEFKGQYPGIYNEFNPKITSRVNKYEGGLTEEEKEKEPDVIASNVNFGGTTTPIKPVQKLDYATLRDRLPKEINDQVVQLLASSEQALQDFAYITSQNDVNNFNVKYGVNLIIPPVQQTT
jgi:hypothetical protein